MAAVASTTTTTIAAADEYPFAAKGAIPTEMDIFFNRDESARSNAGGGQPLDGVAERPAQSRVIGLEADLRLFERVDQTGVLLLAGGFEPALHFGLEAGQHLPVLVALRSADGGREFVEQMTQMLFHGGNATGRGACT